MDIDAVKYLWSNDDYSYYRLDFLYFIFRNRLNIQHTYNHSLSYSTKNYCDLGLFVLVDRRDQKEKIL